MKLKVILVQILLSSVYALPKPQDEPQNAAGLNAEEIKGSTPNSVKNEPETGKSGGVTTENETCSEIGVEMLKKGGSAVDAAIAGTICIGVVNVFSTNIGGGGFAIVHTPSGEANTFNFRETAPGAMNEDTFEGKFDATETGGLAVGVPGEVAGFAELHEKYGKLQWAELFTPSVELARKGFPMSRMLVERVGAVQDAIKNSSEFRKVFFNEDGEFLAEGDTVKRPSYADTLEAIAKDGPDAFYHGSIAEDIVQTVKDAGGIMTLEDFANYKVDVDEPIKSSFRNRTVLTVTAPASGAVLLSILNIMDLFPKSEEYTPTELHRMVEAFKFGYAQRSELGDPNFDDDVIDVVSRLINPETAMALKGKLTDGETHPTDYYDPKFDQKEDHGTQNVGAIDSEGMAVSLTSTVNLILGAKLMTKTGIVLNNQIDDFSVPGKFADSRLPPAKANYPGPGKRPMSSIAPAILLNEEGKVELIIGASGGTKITSCTAETIINAIDHNLNIQEAINRARIHHQLFPNKIEAENGFPDDILAELESFGHEISKLDPGKNIANMHGIRVLPDGEIEVGSDWRKNGRGAAY